MKPRLLLAISQFIFLFHFQGNAQKIIRNDPYFSTAYLGLNFGVNSKSYTNMGLDLQSYFYKAKLVFEGRMNFQGPMTSLYAAFDDGYQVSFPKEGLKKTYDMEFSLGYNFFQKRYSTKTRVVVKTDAAFYYTTNIPFNKIKTYAIRMGFGQYRSVLRGNYAYMADGSFNYSGGINQYYRFTPENTSQDYFGEFATNHQTSYLFAGLQISKLVSYRLKEVNFLSRINSRKIDTYFDLMFAIKHKLGNFYNPFENQSFTTSKIKKGSLHNMGARAGFRFRPIRKFNVVLGAEAGLLPGLKTNLRNLNFDETNVVNNFYGKAMASFTIVGPYKKYRLESQK